MRHALHLFALAALGIVARPIKRGTEAVPVSVRRYLAVVQDPRGYPARGEPLEAAPPEGPAPPVLHTVVLADDYEALKAENARLRPIVAHVAGLATPDADGYSKVHRTLIDDARSALGS